MQTKEITAQAARQHAAEDAMLAAARAAIGHRTKADAIHEWYATPTGHAVLRRLIDQHLS